MATKGKLSLLLAVEPVGSSRAAGETLVPTSSFNFPSLVERAPLLVTNRPRRGESSTRAPTIAIVEDEHNLLSAYSSLFDGMGFHEQFLSEDGEAIVAAVESGEFEPDIVIMDYRLPNMNGLEAARRIAKVLPKAKIIFTTADESIKDEVQAMGMIFLLKPFTLEMLATSVSGK